MEQEIFPLSHVNRQTHEAAGGVIKFSHIAMGACGVNLLRPADRQRIVVGSDAMFHRSPFRSGNHLPDLIVPVIKFIKQDAIRCLIPALVEKVLQPYFLPVKGLKVFSFRGLPDSA